MRLAIALLALCTSLLPIGARAQTVPLTELLLSTQFGLAAGVVQFGDLRTRVATVEVGGDRQFQGGGDLHMRFGGSMVDYYPISGQGFRLSIGLRLFVRHDFVREAEKASGQRLLPARGFPGFGSGRRRYTPAAMFGYNLPLWPNGDVSFEGGAVLGRLEAIAPGLNGRHSLAAVQVYPQAGINRVVRAALAMRF